MGGGMEVNRNRWIEEWGADRENLELKFRFTRRSLAIIGIFGLAVPILVYKGIVREFVSTPDPPSSSRPISARISFSLSPNPKPNLTVWLEMDAAYAGRGRRPALQEVPVSLASGGFREPGRLPGFGRGDGIAVRFVPVLL
jgi:hypothetical protein